MLPCCSHAEPQLQVPSLPRSVLLCCTVLRLTYGFLSSFAPCVAVLCHTEPYLGGVPSLRTSCVAVLHFMSLTLGGGFFAHSLPLLLCCTILSHSCGIPRSLAPGVAVFRLTKPYFDGSFAFSFPVLLCCAVLSLTYGSFVPSLLVSCHIAVLGCIILLRLTEPYMGVFLGSLAPC